MDATSASYCFRPTCLSCSVSYLNLWPSTLHLPVDINSKQGGSCVPVCLSVSVPLWDYVSREIHINTWPIKRNQIQRIGCLLISILLWVKYFSRGFFSISPLEFFFSVPCFSLASLRACQGSFSRGVSLHCTFHFLKANWSCINRPVSPTQQFPFSHFPLCLSLVTKIIICLPKHKLIE